MKRTMHALLALALLAGPMIAQAAVVTVGNREWRQLTETTGSSWNQVATVCNPATGVCSGSIGAVSFDGWTWASNTDIQGLFTALIGDFFPSPTSVYIAPGGDDANIAAAVNGGALFGATFNFPPFSRGVQGWSRDSESVPDAFSPIILDFLRPGSQEADLARLSLIANKDSIIGTRGVWLSRPASEVPVPPAAYLLVSGLAGLLGLARKRPGKAAAV